MPRTTTLLAARFVRVTRARTSSVQLIEASVWGEVTEAERSASVAGAGGTAVGGGVGVVGGGAAGFELPQAGNARAATAATNASRAGRRPSMDQAYGNPTACPRPHEQSCRVVPWSAVTEARHYRAGQPIEDLCRACKTTRAHTVIAVDAQGRAVRVMCDFCRSEHNYRGGGDDAGAPAPAPPGKRERTETGMSPIESGEDLERMLRRLLREELGLTAVVAADRWRGGELVLRPGRPGLQEKKWPIESFFHKIVMIRNRLRTLEQQVNASEVPEDAKVRLQSYITACYGTLTSFNVLFADEEDQFKGASGGD
jgi:hypothetical protein